MRVIAFRVRIPHCASVQPATTDDSDSDNDSDGDTDAWWAAFNHEYIPRNIRRLDVLKPLADEGKLLFEGLTVDNWWEAERIIAEFGEIMNKLQCAARGQRQNDCKYKCTDPTCKFAAHFKGVRPRPNPSDDDGDGAASSYDDEHDGAYVRDEDDYFNNGNESDDDRDDEHRAIVASYVCRKFVQHCSSCTATLGVKTKAHEERAAAKRAERAAKLAAAPASSTGGAAKVLAGLVQQQHPHHHHHHHHRHHRHHQRRQP